MNLDTSLPALLLVGLPLSFIAAGLLLNAYLIVRRARIDPTDAALEALARESEGELLIELQRSVEDIRGQLTRQRTTLTGLLSDAARYSSPAPALASPPAPASTAAIAAPPIAPAAAGPSPPAGELRAAVGQLVAEGLSDRAIARRLRIGLEEVRLARMGQGGTS